MVPGAVNHCGQLLIDNGMVDRGVRSEPAIPPPLRDPRLTARLAVFNRGGGHGGLKSRFRLHRLHRFHASTASTGDGGSVDSDAAVEVSVHRNGCHLTALGS